MQKDELLVLLKILRGAASIPNVTFICAFSEKQIRNEIATGGNLAPDYLEKFFPVSVNLAAPDPDMIGRCFQDQLKRDLGEQKWFNAPKDAKKFAELLDRAWGDALYRVCTNLRKAGLLVNDVLTATRAITGEVDPFDLVAIEAVRRFYPEVYRSVRTNAPYLTFEASSWNKHRYSREERKKKESMEFFQKLEAQIDLEHEPTAVRVLLALLFPEYAKANEGTTVYQYVRRTNEETAADEKRICDGDYFPIYFRAAVPEDMASNAEVGQLISELNRAQSETDVNRVFSEVLDSIPANHPKRNDLLWKLGLESDRLSDITAERLAYAAAARADSYAYDLINVGEAARALNLVFHAAQKMSSSPAAQRILEGALSRASDDTFAKRILEYTAAPERNRVLTDFSNVSIEEIKSKFTERMRKRYAPENIQTVNIAQGDWWAFGFWVNHSDEDRDLEQEFWRRFIGRSRKKLAQAINFIYPRMAWTSDPTPTVDRMFPMKEFANLLVELPEGEELDEPETKSISRMQDLLVGKYPNPMDM